MDLTRTLVIAPHPDDDVIAAGGLMQHVLAGGGELQILFVTDGENNPWPQRWLDRKWFLTREDRARWGVLRRSEARCSLTQLGVSSAATTFLSMPDQGVAAMIRRGDLRLLRAIRAAIVGFQPTLIVSPSSRDLHADHRAVAWAAHCAASADVPVTTYAIHAAGDERRLAFRIPLSRIERERKRAAIECHHSQLLLSRARFVAHAAPAESFYAPEYDLIGVESAARERLMALRQAWRIAFAVRPPAPPSGIEPAADIEDGAGDVAGLF